MAMAMVGASEPFIIIKKVGTSRSALAHSCSSLRVFPFFLSFSFAAIGAFVVSLRSSLVFWPPPDCEVPTLGVGVSGIVSRRCRTRSCYGVLKSTVTSSIGQQSWALQQQWRRGVGDGCNLDDIAGGMLLFPVRFMLVSETRYPPRVWSSPCIVTCIIPPTSRVFRILGSVPVHHAFNSTRNLQSAYSRCNRL